VNSRGVQQIACRCLSCRRLLSHPSIGRPWPPRVWGLFLFRGIRRRPFVIAIRLDSFIKAALEQTKNIDREATMKLFTVPAAGRDPRKPKLSLAEASQMAEAGFKFSIFDPAGDEYNVSRPYQVAQDLQHQTLTFMQA
jgi:hypothetical protein